MPEPMLLLPALTAALACASLGGGFYQFSVVDPYWPARPDIAQPQYGGINPKLFWIPIHVAFELALIASLVVTWHAPTVRNALLVALASHAVMRVWSAFDFIPKALAFERAEPGTIDPAAIRRWTRRSLGRLPLDLITCGAVLAALIAAARLG